MNAFYEFQEAWAQRFPGCELPEVWVEDITTNLMKHRQKLAALKEELEKVEFYVQYLENLAIRYAETSSSQTVVIKSEEICESDYVLFNDSYDSHQECPSVVSSHKRVVGCSLNTQNSVVEKSPEYTVSCSQTVVIKSEENCEDDYVLFNESYVSHQECPSGVSSYKRVAGCSLNTQNSVVEKSPECTASMKTDHLHKDQKGVFSKNIHHESAADFAKEDAYLGGSFCYHKVELEDVGDSSEKKENETSENSDDVFEGDSDKLVKLVDMPKITASSLTSSVDDIKYNCQVLLYDIFAGRKRKKDQEEAEEDSDYEKDDDSDYEKEAKEDSDYEKDDDSDYEDEANEISDHAKDDDPDYEMETIINSKKKTLPLQGSKRLSSYEKMVEQKRAERIAFMKSMGIDQDEANEISDHEKDDDSDYEMETIRNSKKKTLKKAKRETLPSQKSKGLSSYEKMIEKERSKRIAFMKAMEINQAEANKISDHENDDDSDDEMETIRNSKKKTLKKAIKETLPSQESKGLSSYEKMIEEKRAERLALMKSMEIDQIKEGISEAIGGIKQLKKNPVKKAHLPSSIEPIRRSNRLQNTEINFSENALEELAVKNAFQVSPPSSPFEIPLEFSFEDVLKSKSSYEECVNDLSVQKPKCNQEYISYDKAVFENMTLKNFHAHKVVSWKITSVAWYPSKEDLIVAAGDKFGNLNLWKIQDSVTTPYLFSIHDGIISNLQFNSFDPVQLITSSFDGTMLCGDLIKHTFNEIYDFGSNRVTWFDFLSHKILLVSYWNKVAVLDSGTNGKTSEQRHTCSDSLINTVSVHPVNNNIFVTCDSKKSIRLWDLRKLQKDPIVEILHHKNTVNSAYFSPVTGNSILTTSIDDSICIFDSTKLTQDIELTWMMTHNNSYRHRFRATWLPHSDDLFAVGFLAQEEEQRKIQIYDKDLNLYHNMKNDNLKTITSVHCFHPYRSALAVGSKAGFSAGTPDDEGNVPLSEWLKMQNIQEISPQQDIDLYISVDCG